MSINHVLSDVTFPPDQLASWVRARASKEPWLLLDLGTNGYNDPTSPGGLQYASVEWHTANLRKAIAKFRAATGDPGTKILLRTAFPRDLDTSTSYYQQAAIRVSQQDANVICCDTFGAATAGGGYATAVSNGWMADAVHRSTAGKEAFERMFDAIIGGGNWTHSATVG
jgi:hypothetical protein